MDEKNVVTTGRPQISEEKTMDLTTDKPSKTTLKTTDQAHKSGNKEDLSAQEFYKKYETVLERLEDISTRLKNIEQDIEEVKKNGLLNPQIKREGPRVQIFDVKLKILDALERRSMTAKELAHACGYKDRASFQKNHLRPMVDEKIIKAVKSGRHIFYKLEK